MTSVYLLDANMFIDAKNHYYRFDTFPVFWNWLDAALANSQLVSIQMIRDELLKGHDELAEWIEARQDWDCFLPVDDEPTQRKLGEVASWVMNQPYKDEAKSDFLDCGDPWLIAKAVTAGATVVTHETYEPLRLNKVKIPNVCRAFDVPYLSTFDLLQRLGVKFQP